VVAEGELGMLKELETWCRRGPAGARVERVNSRWEDVTNQFTDFRIRR
jgi:acylphosphatase